MSTYATHRYHKSFSGARTHVRYIAFRERESKEEKLGLFSADEDSADVKTFLESLKDKKLSHSSVPTIHTVLFTMSGDEWNRSGFQKGDYQKMIRRMMKDWEIKKGYKLNWVAGEHHEEGHPHVHVAIKASYTDRDGIERRLHISNEDRKYFREHFEKIKEMERPIDPPSFERSQRLERTKSFSIADNFINNLLYKMDKELEEEERERERTKRKKPSRGRSR